MNNIYDLIIIGAGPAGLTAGIYASRRKMKNLILTKNIGGQAASVPHIENYPGLDMVDGFKLTDDMKKQAEKFGSKIIYEPVIKIEKKNKLIEVKTSKNQYQAKTLILSYGVIKRKLDIPGEKALENKGVTYCANCDAPLYKNKTVAVIGGGNSALDAAEYLSKIATKVYLIHRRDQFRADEIVVDKVKQADNVEILTDTIITKINGQEFVTDIDLENINTQEKNNLEVNGVFIEIGHIVNCSPVEGQVDLDQENQIKTDYYCNTSCEGVFAAGDVTQGEYKQIVIAAGEGAKAALSAYKYLQHLKGAEANLQDWNN